MLAAPQRGFLTCSSDGNNYGATCEHHCERGYERRGPSSRVCQFDRSWEGSLVECVRESARKISMMHENATLYTREVLIHRCTCGFCAFVAMEIKSDVRTLSDLLNQFYEKRRLLIVSAPNISDPDYQLQNTMIQVRRGVLPLGTSHQTSSQT